MRCPACGNPDTRVIDSREAEDDTSIRRRRVCDRCEERFTTFERSESARIQVQKRDGTKQEFDRRKLASAIEKAASKGLAADDVSRLIDDLESSAPRFPRDASESIRSIPNASNRPRSTSVWITAFVCSARAAMPSSTWPVRSTT